MRLRSVRLAAAVVALAPNAARAQATPNVGPLEPAYRQVDVLAATGMADVVIVGMRPYSRREIARIAAGARRTAARWTARLDDPALPAATRRRLAARLAAGRAALDALESTFGPEIAAATARSASARSAPAPRLRALDVLAADLTATNAAPRATPGTPLGTSDAVVMPLAEYREGRPVGRGATAFVETAHRAESRWLAGAARLRLRLAGAGAGEDVRYAREQALTVHDAHLRAVAGPFAVTVGRDHLVWGQGRLGGALLGANAPALDLVMLSTDVPIRVPVVHHLLGPMKGGAFFADLGPRQNFPGANLTGYRLDARPLRWLEIGVATVNQWGGRGAPAAPASRRLLDQLLVVDSFTGVEDFQFSNKLAGFDARITIPALGGLAAYYELQLDDFDHNRLGTLAREDAGQVIGLRAAALGPDGRWELGAETRHTGLRYYQHTEFTSGVTYERFFLGDPLGPQALGTYVRAGRRAGAGGVWLDLAAERRGNDQYVSVEDPTFRFVLTERRPTERRLRAVATWEARTPGRAVSWLAQLGAERATDLRFAAGADRTNLLARVGVELRPR